MSWSYSPDETEKEVDYDPCDCSFAVAWTKGSAIGTSNHGLKLSVAILQPLT